MPKVPGKKEGPGFPGPWVACNRLSMFSLAGQMASVKAKIERAFSPRLFGEERRPLGTAGAGLEPTSLRLTDGGFTILSYPAILSLYTVMSAKMFPREAMA